MLKSSSPMVSFRSFVVSGLMFKTLVHYELILVYFIPKYFIYFYAIINGIVFLISFTDSMYRNATFFPMLYPATLLNLLVLILCGGVFRVFYTDDHIIRKQIILLLPF